MPLLRISRLVFVSESVARLHLLLRSIVTGYRIELRRCGLLVKEERKNGLFVDVCPLQDWDCCPLTRSLFGARSPNGKVQCDEVEVEEEKGELGLWPG